MSLVNGQSHNGTDGSGVSSGEMNETCISVRSLWKVFGNNPEQVMGPDYAEKTKAEIIEWGLRLGVDYGLTTSCYDPGASGAACGHCDACLLRRKGFAANGVADPVDYVVL